MGRYIQIEFACSRDEKDILIANLAEIGFEGFEETDNGLKAFISEKDYDENVVKGITRQYSLSFTKTLIEETNWNQVWESNFDPIIIDDFAGIRAEFHQPVENVKHELIVTPKMSFGTGHHATTFMMIQQMRQIDFAGKSVFDFGTGTGILAILAQKLGAKKIVAVDHDDWSIDNAMENIQNNKCSLIELRQAGTAEYNDAFDIILANINKNVILDNLPLLVNELMPGGILLISGLLQEDQDDIFHISKAYSLQLLQTTVRDNWLCLKFSG